ncbi:salicylate 1-monooxygenase [Moniliophthora roreri]|nr:salicylate 1-monooxygenase [Moniliophthora roreri]
MVDFEKHVGMGTCRPVFLDISLKMLDFEIVHLSKRRISIQSAGSGGAVIHFADGFTYKADVVTGADGIRSVTREWARIPQNRYFAAHNVFARAGVQTDLGKDPIYFVSPGKGIVSYPIGGGTMVHTEQPQILPRELTSNRLTLSPLHQIMMYLWAPSCLFHK